MADEALPTELVEQGAATLLPVDFATLVVTAFTILVASALAIIAFYLNRDFREQVRATQEQGELIKAVSRMVKETEARIDRNVLRDALVTRVVFDIVGDLINAEKIGRYAQSNATTEQMAQLLDVERNRFFEQITRRVRELSLVLSNRDDKKEQVLSEIVAEEPDRSTIRFLATLIDVETNELWKEKLNEAKAIASYKQTGMDNE